MPTTGLSCAYTRRDKMIGSGAIGGAPFSGDPYAADMDFAGIVTLTQVEQLAELIQVADDGSCND